ncbi:MAG: hypothetical protein AAFY71_11540 [Bacteroidota bacterium]
MQKLLQLTILTLFLASCSTADLSSPAAMQEDQGKGRAILQKAMIAHGAQKWDSIQTYEAIFRDEFYGMVGKMASNFSGNPVKVSLKYIPKTQTAQAKFLHEDMKNEVWGILDGKPYAYDKEDQVAFEEDFKKKFWLPTYQYFIEFPARILEANVIRYMGQEKIKEEAYDKVFASWNKVEPQDDVDQYVVWVHPKTHQIKKIAYTIREANNWVTGHASLENFKTYNGMLFPGDMLVGSSLLKEGKLLHKMSIDEVTFNSFPQSDLMNP